MQTLLGKNLQSKNVLDSIFQIVIFQQKKKKKDFITS